MRPLFKDPARSIEGIDDLDRVGKPLAKLVGQLVPSGSQIKDFLSGTWLGEPLHPPLTDVVIGSWTSAVMLDWLAGKHANRAAERLIGLGILAALPTAASGLADWAELRGATQRVGVVHATGNVTALGLFTMSWLARKRGHQVRGRLYAILGIGASSASAYLGGHLSFERGVGVNQAAFEALPEKWQAVVDEETLPDSKLSSASANGTAIVFYKHDGQIDAIADRCSHRGCSLHQGSVQDDESVICPCHGSRFRLSDGAVLHGPATMPQPAFETRVRKGKVEVRRKGSDG